MEVINNKNMILSEGCILRDGETGDRYRVYALADDKVYMCQMDITSLQLLAYSELDVRSMVRSNQFIQEDDEPLIVDESKYSTEIISAFTKRTQFLDEVETALGPTFMDIKKTTNSALINQIMETHGISRKSGWKYIRLYLQSGRQMSAVFDMRRIRTAHAPYQYTQKTGRPVKWDNPNRGIPLTDKVLDQFEKHRLSFLKKKYKTYRLAYLDLLDEYYSYRGEEGDVLWVPEAERPTLRQFTHYCKTRSTREELDKKHFGAKDQRNNCRLLLGSTKYGVIRPGQVVEVDALESDIAIVSELNQGQAIGRPIVYAMIDVYSHAIIAITTGYNNNSYLGLSSLFLNLIDDKQQYCRQYGIDYDGDLWPSCIIPESGKYDHGSDFVSKAFLDMCQRLRIRADHVTPGMGSLKPVVESSFHLFQRAFRDGITGKGLIEKDGYGNPHKKASLTNFEFTRMLIGFVLFHNQRINTNYRRTKEMIEENVSPRPAEIWKFGVKTAGSPRTISATMRPQLYFDMMLPADTATVSRRGGIRFKDLIYLADDDYLLDRMMAAGNKRIPFEARYDPRDVGSIYYLHENRIIRATLNEQIMGNADFAELTHAEYDLYLDEKRRMSSLAEVQNLELDGQMHRVMKDIINAAPGDGAPSIKNMREMRDREKQYDNYTNRISTRAEFADDPMQPEHEKDQQPYSPPFEYDPAFPEDYPDKELTMDDPDFFLKVTRPLTQEEHLELLHRMEDDY